MTKTPSNLGNSLKILKIDASARSQDSTSRSLSNLMVETLKKRHENVHVKIRDVAQGLPFVDEAWVSANFTPAESRTEEQKQKLALSDELVAEIKEADILVLGSPIYNFGIPASLKAWVDMICRARVSFRYTENGPVGLMKGKKAFIAIASGGTRLNSEIDFAGSYLRHVLGFIGIDDVVFIQADAQQVDGEAKMASARRQIGRAAALTAENLANVQ